MRKISALQILAFILAMVLTLGLALPINWLLVGQLPLGDFRGVVMTLTGVVFVYLVALVFYRLLLWIVPLRAGEIDHGSKDEFVYHIHLLFHLMLFTQIVRTGALPVPLMRPFYQALGAKLGENTHSAGLILDPLFVQLGDYCIVGQYALIVPHVIEGSRLAHYPVIIGNRVTIGTHAVVLSDVVIGDDAIVAAGAIVSKGTRIGTGEVWGGVPARRIGTVLHASTNKG
ncbi:MAG: hypothetical protein RIS44_2336 [Pseudomonadota bacterium]|jgi:hypothetical protein